MPVAMLAWCRIAGMELAMLSIQVAMIIAMASALAVAVPTPMLRPMIAPHITMKFAMLPPTGNRRMKIAMILPDIAMIFAMAAVPTIAVAVRLWNLLNVRGLLLARDLSDAGEEPLARAANLDLLIRIGAKRLGPLIVLGLTCAPFKPRLASDGPNSLALRLLDTLRALPDLAFAIRRAFTLNTRFAGFVGLLTVPCERSSRHHDTGHQDGNKKLTHNILHRFKSDLASRWPGFAPDQMSRC